MDVYWLEQTDADVPAENQWLSAGEILSLGRLRFARRRDDWRLGRWTAKRALAACFNLPCDLFTLANIEIRTAASGAPEVFPYNETAPVTISLSHRAGLGMCVVAPSGHGIGCDLEMIEPRSNAFITDYLTGHEQALVERTIVEERPLLVTLLWSAKESALKALQVGLRLDTNCMNVSLANGLPPHNEQPRPDEWRPLQVRYTGEQVFYGWWRHTDHMVRTIVSDLGLRPPLHTPDQRAQHDVWVPASPASS